MIRLCEGLETQRDALARIGRDRRIEAHEWPVFDEVIAGLDALTSFAADADLWDQLGQAIRKGGPTCPRAQRLMREATRDGRLRLVASNDGPPEAA